MKTAIVMTGHCRLFEKTHKSLYKSIVSGKDVDIFCHFWDKYDCNCKCNQCRQQKPHLPLTDTILKLDELKQVYSPKNIVISTPPRDEILQYSSGHRLNQYELDGFFGKSLYEYVCMLWSWRKVKTLVEEYEKENNFQYDQIIKVRTDILFDTAIDTHKYNAEKTVFTPGIASYYSNGANDQFAVANANIMKTYLSLYDSVVEYCDRRVCHPLRPETLLKHHFITNHIRIDFIQMKYFILRANGDILFPLGPNMDCTNNQKMIEHLL